MSRRHLTFTCKGETLAGTLDDAPGKVGLLIVTGGNEIRAGAFSGQAKLAHHIAENGYPVFRFDRRGVGNSGGENGGYTSSQPDIAAAKAAFLAAAPQVECIVAHGNCDAATAVMAFSAVDARIVSNSWVYGDGGEDTGAAPPAAAIRSRYAEKLKNPREVLRLLTGGVSLGKLFRGLLAAIKPRPASHCDEALRIAALVSKATRPRKRSCWPEGTARRSILLPIGIRQTRAGSIVPTRTIPSVPARHKNGISTSYSPPFTNRLASSTWVDQRNWPTGRTSASL